MSRNRIPALAAVAALLAFSAAPASAHGHRRASEQGADAAQATRFLAALESSEPVVCGITVDNIGNNWGGPGRRAGVGRLSDHGGDEALRLAVAHGLQASAVPVAAERLGDANPCVRRAAARLLGQTATDAARSTLRAKLKDASARIREAAALGLGEMGGESGAREDLVRALHDADVTVVRMSAWALGETEDARSAPPLLELVPHADAGVRAAAIASLGNLHVEGSAAAIAKRLGSDTSAEVRELAAEALGEIGGKSSGPALASALSDRELRVKRAAARALGEVKYPQALDALGKAVSDPDPELRGAAVRALGELADPRAASVLAKALTDTDLEVKRSAVHAFGELGELKKAPPALVEALSDSDADTRAAAAHALAEIKDPSSVKALGRALQDPVAEVRRSAVRALSEIEGAASTPYLVAALKDSDAEVRRHAAAALGDRR